MPHNSSAPSGLFPVFIQGMSDTQLDLYFSEQTFYAARFFLDFLGNDSASGFNGVYDVLVHVEDTLEYFIKSVEHIIQGGLTLARDDLDIAVSSHSPIRYKVSMLGTSGWNFVQSLFNSFCSAHAKMSGSSYNWETWQQDHFVNMGEHYPMVGYDWESWVDDLFSDDTSLDR